MGRFVASSKKSFGFIFCILVLVFFATCSSSKSLTVPGEDKIRAQNMASEYYSLAQDYEENKNYSKAILYYQKSMADDSLYTSAYYKVGLCNALSGNWQKAQNIFGELLIKDAENDTIKESLAYVCAKGGKLEKSALLYEELANKNPVNPSYLKNCILVNILNKNTEKAKVLFETFKTNFPMQQETIQELEEKLSTSLVESK